MCITVTTIKSYLVTNQLPPLRNVVPLLKVRVVGHPSRLSNWSDSGEGSVV